MNTKIKEGARNKGNPYFLRVPWNKGGLVNTGPGLSLFDLKRIRGCYISFALYKCFYSILTQHFWIIQSLWRDSQCTAVPRD